MKKPITIGTPVTFDSEHGPQRGTVADIKQDVGNGEPYALIDVPGTMNGKPWPMPISDLQRTKVAA